MWPGGIKSCHGASFCGRGSCREEVPILANAPGDMSLLKPGVAVFVIALKKPDGTATAARLYAEKDGIKPPM